MQSELLFHTGLTLTALAAAGGLFAAVLLRRSRKRLDAKLDAEYGEKRRRESCRES